MQPAVQSGQVGSHARLFRSGLGLQLYCSHPTLPSNLAFVAPSGTAAFLGRSNAPLLHPPLSHLLLLPTTIPYFNHLCISSSDIFLHSFSRPSAPIPSLILPSLRPSILSSPRPSALFFSAYVIRFFAPLCPAYPSTPPRHHRTRKMSIISLNPKIAT